MSLFFPEPRNIDFLRWASAATEELSKYNIATPCDEKEWKSWAINIYNIDDIQGIPNPIGFDDWESWAAIFFDVAQGQT